MMTSINTDIFALFLALLAGVILGCAFFYSLWFTVQKGLQSNNPAFWFLGGVLLRMSSALLVFYWMSNNNMWRLIVCLIGFILGRLLITRYLAKKDNSSVVDGEPNNAP
ncbi:ATP synthase subunit I [Paraglaciecola sp. 25GB23A]|uniref:N-ATPase subunit AtpR n=1 Tax=Paraglaciecola sp. 25GB23A TaxID=3156068 RepID=UPI0032AFD584|tara:strand:- start:10675 stop:11001 length:327 start_codon:yes stop_codon:yes gene_type:complete